MHRRVGEELGWGAAQVIGQDATIALAGIFNKAENPGHLLEPTTDLERRPLATPYIPGIISGITTRRNESNHVPPDIRAESSSSVLIWASDELA